KLGLPERDSGVGYSADQVYNMPKFDFAGIMDYFDAVRRETNRYLDSISVETLDHVPHPERRPGYTIGKMFSHVIVEEAQHVGQVAYLRGMERGLGN
ncbi:MAG: DinB family protein, partial [Ardenticatenaceae bacterium]